MGFQDVAFQPSCASFSTTFLNNCDRGARSLRMTTCLKTVVGVSKVKYFCSNKASFCVSQISWRS